MALVIFDYDGVLADTLADLIQFGQEACDQLGVKHHVTKADLSNLEVMSFATYGQACEVPQQLVDEFVQICLQCFAEKQSPPAIFPGLSDVIKRLALQNTLAIVTTNSTQNVVAFLSAYGLAQCVEAVYGVDMPGSKSQKITLARKQFLADAKSTSAFMIGDSLSDMRAAKAAETASIAVTWGHQSLEHLLRGAPGYVVNAPHELVKIIEEQNVSGVF